MCYKCAAENERSTLGITATDDKEIFVISEGLSTVVGSISQYNRSICTVDLSKPKAYNILLTQS